MYQISSPFLACRLLTFHRLLGLGLLLSPLASCGEQKPVVSSHSNAEAVDLHIDEGGHLGAEPVELSDSQAKAAGISLFKVGPGPVERRLVLPAVVEPDTNALSHITPKISGVVSEVHMGLGQTVKRGDLVCVIDSVELSRDISNYRKARELAASSKETLASEQGLFSRRLQAATDSHDEILALRRETLKREEELREQQVSTVRPLLDAERSYREAQIEKSKDLADLIAIRDTRFLALENQIKERSIDEESALGHLEALGIEEEDLRALLASGNKNTGEYPIRAQRDGVVIKRLLSVGQYVEVGTEMYEILDLSRVWIVASAFEDVIRLVEGGQQAEVRLHAFPELMIRGEVVLINYSVDPESRSLALRIELDNVDIEAWQENFPLRPGMFGEVSLVVESHEVPLAIPEEALVHDSGIDAVFVQVEEGHFEKRTVVTIGGDGELVEVRPVPGTGEPLRAGELIAVGGVFTLKSIDKAGELGSHGH